MHNYQLEHIIRASCSITGENNIVIIGSQAILASFDSSKLPALLTQSIEADVFYLTDNSQALTDLIDGSIGEASMFQDTHGIYAHGVGKDTAVLPHGWESRLVKLNNDNTFGYTALCLDPYDLCVSKLIANREKDREYVEALLSAKLLDVNILKKRLLSVNGYDYQKDKGISLISRFAPTLLPPPAP